MTREIELRLIGHASADGQILAPDALGLIGSFKDVAYRLTRAVADRPGLGRTDAVLERLATVRVALREGSTRLIFIVGDDSALEIDPISDGVDDAFWSIVRGLQTNVRPAAISDAVADSVDDMVVALAKAAPQAEVTVPGHEAIMLTTRAVNRALWQRHSSESAAETVVHGLLEMVDLHTARFRVRDVSGNAIDLLDVVEADAVAHLVGESVTATGFLALGVGTGHHRMERPIVTAEMAIATRLEASAPPSLELLIKRSRTAPEPPALDLSDAEFDDFLAAIRA